MPERPKYTISWGLPPFGSFAEGLKFSVGAEHHDELRNSLDAVFGEGTYDRVIGRLAQATFEPNPTTAASVPASAGATGVNTGQGPAPVPAGGGYTGGASLQQGQTYGACPECGTGQVVDKFRRGTGQKFGVGCNNYPACNYMQSWVNS